MLPPGNGQSDSQASADRRWDGDSSEALAVSSRAPEAASQGTWSC